VRAYICIVYISLILLAAGNAAGCTASGGGTDKFPVPVLATVALPYVEAVHLPTEIHAGQAFTVTVDLSCDLNPAVLRSPAHPISRDHFIDSYYNITAQGRVDTYFAVIRPLRDPAQMSNSLPVVTSIAYTFDALPAGVHTLYYLSSPTCEQGGMSVQVH
jgi:hypothetical protein